MFVLTNESNLFGAACSVPTQIFCSIMPRKHRQIFYILPSSIHEVILVPTLENSDYQELSEIVQEVNDTQLQDDEILNLRTPIIIHVKKMKSRCNNVYEFTLNARETSGA